jgi:hypothetical protein
MTFLHNLKKSFNFNLKNTPDTSNVEYQSFAAHNV